MMNQINGYHILFEPGSDPAATPLLLLHGTGGDESSLMALGRAIAPDAPLLGVRGTVMEGPTTRWFRRFGEGILDMDDVTRRADELATFIELACIKLRFAAMPIAIGYSNGANIASALLMRQPEMLHSAVLMRGMDTIEPVPGLSLAGKRILYLSGAADPLAPAESRARMTAKMKAAGAEVTEMITGPDHDISLADAKAARDWLSLPAAQVA
jgi:phospholipase/carboxylesterase